MRRRGITLPLVVVAAMSGMSLVASVRADDAATRPSTAPVSPQVAAPLETAAAAVPPPVDRTASLAARREVEAARLAMRRAEAGNRTAYGIVEQEFRSSLTYRLATLELRRAQAAYDRARFPVQSRVRSEPSVQDDLRDRERIRDEMLRLLDSGLASLSAVQPLATAAMEAGRRISEAEAGALAVEPTVDEAREQMLRAAAVVRELVEAHRAALPRDPRVRAARRDLQSAERQLQRASDGLAEALRLEARQERERLEQIESLRRAGQLPANVAG